jgi:phosphoenolpyruvate carboxykinase (ATP)
LEKLLELVEELPSMPNVVTPDPMELRREAEDLGLRTEFGNYMFSSSVRNRSADLTVYVGEGDIPQNDMGEGQRTILRRMPRTLETVIEYLKKVPLYRVDLTMGQNPDFTPHCEMFLSRYRKEYSVLAYMNHQSLFPSADTPGPRLILINLPEWQEKDRQILVFPEEHLTVALGSDYYGEVKKAFLRMGMYSCKQRGMLGLHAGSKLICARGEDGEIHRKGMIIFGLTATGKTTHSCHNHGLELEGEGVKIVQDDVVFLHEDASALGTERGFYIKTDGLRPDTQPLLYSAATRRDTIIENVCIDYRGKVYFQDMTLTGNGRGIIQRTDLGDYMSEGINLPPLDELDSLIAAFITRRNTVLPIASKLSSAQAAGAFMLGESIESSGGDPRRAGESVRVVGTNPFLVGSEVEEGNWFYDFLLEKGSKVECYQLNTGGVGEIMERDSKGRKRVTQKVTRVEIKEMAAIIRGICRGSISWEEDPHFGTLVPEKVEDVNMGRFDLSNFYDEGQIEDMVRKLKQERIEYLSRFDGLHPDIPRAYE